MLFMVIMIWFVWCVFVCDVSARCYSKIVGVGVIDWVKVCDCVVEVVYVYE